MHSGRSLDSAPWQLEVTRFLAPLITALTAVEALAARMQTAHCLFA